MSIFISLEGIDGSGKNSQANMIKDYLESKGFEVEIYSFPRYGSLIGNVISKYLKGDFGDINSVPYELICIAYAADRVAMMKEIKEIMYKDKIIIFDRFTYSNLFTAAKLPKNKQNEFIEWIEKLEFEELEIVKPDYNFYLYVDPEVSIKQIKNRGKRDYQEGKEDIHENNFELLKNAAECYLNFAKNKDNWFIINQMDNDNQLTKKDVFDIIKSKLEFILNKGGV